MSDKPSPPHLVAALTDVLRKVIPNAGDHVTRRVLRLYLRNTGFSFEAFVGPLFELEQRGWIKVNGEIYTPTPKGARAFASEMPVETEAATAEGLAVRTAGNRTRAFKALFATAAISFSPQHANRHAPRPATADR